MKRNALLVSSICAAVGGIGIDPISERIASGEGSRLCSGWVWEPDGSGSRHGVGNVEIGDSASGMQRHNFGGMGSGPAPALHQLRGQLAQLAGQRFAQHQPAQHDVPSPYLDSGQIGINVSQNIPNPPTNPNNWTNVGITGRSTVYRSFKPNRIVCTEQLLVTFTTSALGSSVVVASVSDASDLLLSGAFSGADNTFANAPDATTGINCSAIQANAFGVGISWPTVNSGIPVTAQFLLLNSSLFRAAPPAGYSTANISNILANVFFSMFGPQLR